MKFNRLMAMETYIRKKHSVTNEELMSKFNISVQTLRRDLKELESRRVIDKVYGGVVVRQEKISTAELPALSSRLQTNMEAKERIGMLASQIIQEGDVVFVDSGSTAYRIVPYLTGIKVTVISHSLRVMEAMVNMDNLTGICLGGRLKRDTHTFQSDTSFYTYYYNKAFISTVGLSVTKGLTNTDFDEGVIKRHMIEHAEEVWLLADHSKFGNIAFNHFADFDGITGVITDEKPEDQYCQFFKNHKIKLVY